MNGRLGIIAGGGRLPRRLIDVCQRKDEPCFVLGFAGQTDKSVMENVPHRWSRLGATDEAIRLLKENNVDRVVMAGYIRRPSLREMRPDWRTLRVFAKLGTRAFGDDALLKAVAQELEGEGMRLVGAHEVDPSLITPQGLLGKIQPSPEAMTDMAIAIRAAKELGRMDIGQAVVVQQGIVLGVEAVEGTDALLTRCQDLRRKGVGGVLVKACKPQQDKRLDLPTIGLRTVRKAYEAGLEGIAVEAGASLILERDEVVEAANKLGLFVKGFETP